MKRPWAEDAEEIKDELDKLNQADTSLVLARSGEASCSITIRSLFVEGGLVLLEFSKPPTVVLDEAEPYYVFYQPEAQGLMRGFSLLVLQQSEHAARAALPLEIFEVQRRKHPRVFTPSQSSLTCMPINSRRLVTATIIDVSLEGARIFGDLEGIGKGSVLAPLTLTLYYRDLRVPPVVVNVAEAVVVREVRVDEKYELCFHFEQANADQEQLASYISHRAHELDHP